MDSVVVAGGNSSEPLSISGIVTVTANGKERFSAILQGAEQMLLLEDLQIGDGGTNPVYLNLDATAIELPSQYNESTKKINYNSTDNVIGITYYPGASDTILHTNSVITSPSRYKWGLHASASTSATYSFSGLQVIGAGTITLNKAITVTELTINDYSTLDVSGLTFNNGTILNMPATSDSITTSSSTVISNSSITTTTVTAGNRWASVATADLDMFSGNTFTGSSTSGHAIRLSSTGTVNFSGNTFTSYGPAARSFNAATGVNTTTDVITLDDTHGYSDGDPAYFQDQGGTAPTGLTDGNLYYVRSESTTTITLYDTSAHAIAGGATGRADISVAGSGTQYIYSAAAAIYNNSGGAVTINVTDGGTSPSIRNSDGSSTTVNVNANVTVTIKDASGNALPGVEVAIFQDNTARTVVLASTSTNASGEVTTTAQQNLGAIIIRARQSTNIASFLTNSSGITDTVNDIITALANHNFATTHGDAVVYSKNGGSASVGLTAGNTYYVRYLSANTLSLYGTAAQAITGGATGRADLSTDLAETHLLDPVRYVAGSATGTIGTSDFSTTITLNTDIIATG